MTQEIKFKHLRNIDIDGCPTNFGGMTIAYQQESNGVIAYAVAVCSIDDNFCKSQGRKISSERLQSAKHRNTVKMTVTEFHRAWDKVSDGEDYSEQFGYHGRGDVDHRYDQIFGMPMEEERHIYVGVEGLDIEQIAELASLISEHLMDEGIEEPKVGLYLDPEMVEQLG